MERGEGSRFPFLDLSTGEVKGRTPVVGEGERVRVGREGFRRVMVGGVGVEVGDICIYIYIHLWMDVYMGRER